MTRKEYHKAWRLKNKARCTEYGRRYRLNHPDRARLAQQKYHKTHPMKGREGYLIRAYGITLAEYQQRLEHQKGVCAMCNQPELIRQSFCVDHNHKTGKVRQLLCVRCNSVLGMIDDSIELLDAAKRYLEKHDSLAYF